ncbi:TPA: IS110 family transposase [Legionella pneumophila]|uniref:IS110 family transposase n=3 Tax=Legionella pneumophila TaxID=446 RepID=A0A2S6F3D5_LEGPN|nr:IS110 family transposase [Legionella pneumophila]APF02138.1 IS110 family transposase [Legionella pneumophila subsp. fraseri]APF02506.1 IS110 family transposase [Legionella pneumophila subsp. fraseri]APF05149.1 IS110 family transposase [Legionella pneumophila subsp. fraseri]APF05517.1 IS110 family transposase [Legionella pneumophila subsp. fraseri]AUB67620.1 IS110 family transposase [Legionella pneumophila]
MKDIKVLGIDLAKNVFQLHGINAKSKCVLKKRLTREKLIEFMAQLPPCLVGMEACGGAHYWARMFIGMGHTVKMMAPQFVKPYVKSNKNDANDAEGICEAVTRPNMKFVPVKKIEQQDVLLSHRARELVIKQRTAQANQIRGLLAEYGIVIALGISHIREMTEILENNKLKLTVKSEAIFIRLYEQFKVYDEQVKIYDKEIQYQADTDPMCIEVQKIEGIGPLIASAIVASIGDASVFNNGREVSAWLGLVPKQYSSGNNVRLGGISKRGDRYLRTLLIHGARSALTRCEEKEDKKSKWMADVKQRCGFNKAAVALANKNARTIWALMAHGECYRASDIQESIAA